MDSIDVFPLTEKIIQISRQLQGVAILLVELFLIIFIGFKALNRMEEVEWDVKLWNVALVLVSIAVWPTLVMALKEGIDIFNAFLVREIFGMDWNSNFFAPSFSQLGDAWMNLDLQRGSILFQLLNFLAIILLVSARLIIYGLYWVFLFFLIALGPLILAKGVLMNELEAMRDLLKETIILLLWQTTYVVIFGLFEMDYFGSSKVIAAGENPFLQLAKAFAFAVLTFFVPSITRKYGNHLGSSFFPTGFRWGGAALGFSLLGRVFGMGKRALGFASHHGALSVWKERAFVFEEFVERNRHLKHVQHLEAENSHLKGRLILCAPPRPGEEDSPVDASPRSGSNFAPPSPSSPSPSPSSPPRPSPAPPLPSALPLAPLGPAPLPSGLKKASLPKAPLPEAREHGRPEPTADTPKKEKKEKVSKQEKTFEATRIRLLRGKKDSPKAVHIQSLGIHPNIQEESTEAYILLLEIFNIRYGNFYSIDGEWIAEDAPVPTAKDFVKHVPKQLRAFLRPPEENL